MKYNDETVIKTATELNRENELQDKFKGIHVPFATIWDSDGNIDVEAQKKLCREVSFICDGVFFGGSSGGLGDSLNTKHIVTLVGIGVDVRKELGREDMLIECGACGATAKEAAEMAIAGVAAGADLVVLPPPYFKYDAQKADVELPTGQEAMDKYTFNYYKEFWKLTGLFFSVYNIPGACNGYQISHGLLERIFTEISGAIGIKDSSTKAEVTQAYIQIARKYPGKKVLSGFWPTKDALLGETQDMDADGGVPIEANYLPFIAFVLRIAQLERDAKAIGIIQDILQVEVLDKVVGGKERKGFPDLVQGTVRAVYLIGYGGNHMPQGQRVLDSSLYGQVDAVIEKFGGNKQQAKILEERGIPKQYIEQAEQIIAERKSLAEKAKENLDRDVAQPLSPNKPQEKNSTLRHSI